MTQETFLAHLQEHFKNSNKPDGLALFREKSWQKLLDQGLPSKSHEAYRYVPLKELYSSIFPFFEESTIDKSLFAKEILPECQQSHIVFVDGRLSLELSDLSALPSQILLLPLNEALKSFGSFLQNHLMRTLKEEKDPFAFLNLALQDQGAFFYLPPHLRIPIPIQCLYVYTKSSVAAPRLYLTLGAKSQMHWCTTSHVLDATCPFILPSTEIALEEGAHLDLFNVSDKMHEGWYIESIRACLKKEARLHAVSVTKGGKAFRQSYCVQLKGENSEADLNGLWMLEKNRTAHTYVIVDHEAPYTRSRQLFKGVLNDTAQSSFEGKILVRKEAQKTDAYQLNNNLLLSPGAIANCKPNLEVFADDVKATHGATVSQLDEEQLFYLSTRRIGDSTARKLLIGGFCREMIERIPYASLQRKILGAL